MDPADDKGSDRPLAGQAPERRGDGGRDVAPAEPADPDQDYVTGGWDVGGAAGHGGRGQGQDGGTGRQRPAHGHAHAVNGIQGRRAAVPR